MGTGRTLSADQCQPLFPARQRAASATACAGPRAGSRGLLHGGRLEEGLCLCLGSRELSSPRLGHAGGSSGFQNLNENRRFKII